MADVPAGGLAGPEQKRIFIFMHFYEEWWFGEIAKMQPHALSAALKFDGERTRLAANWN